MCYNKNGDIMKIKRINKILTLVLIGLLVVLTGCKKDYSSVENPEFIELTIMSINDFHGQLEENDDKAGAARIATFINTMRSQNPEGTILLSAGDMFQGTAISNLNHGRDVIDFMNYVDFDAMTIGNHEFDWNLNTILAYRDGDLSNGEANFPFLGANIYQKSTDSIPDNIEEYTILERCGLKIAIVGFIGYDQVDDISSSMVEDYEFLQPLEIARTQIKKARTQDNADVVIICCHEENSGINNMLANGEGDYEVDAIINGHAHNKVNKTILRPSDNVIVPVIQSGSSGEYVGVTTLKIDYDTKEVLGGESKNHLMAATIEEDQQMVSFINNILEETAPVFQRALCTAGSTIYRSTGINWAVQSLFEYANNTWGDFDLAVINEGGIRANAFPINKDEVVTVSKVYQIMPFDNTVKTVEMLGKDVKNLFNISGLSYAGNYERQGSRVLINGKEIDDNAYYKVISIDYIFDKENYPFQNGINKVTTGILFRDILINDLEALGSLDEKWFG